jgi:1-phosphofructokinase family hexose kinase
VIVCVAGNPSVDKVFVVDRLTLDAVHRPLGFVQLAGGKGLNVARAVAGLGAQVRAATILGGHAGRWMAEALAAEGIGGRFVRVAAETRASLAVGDRATGGMTQFVEAHPPVEPDAWWELETAVVKLLAEGAAWLTLSGSLLPGAPDEGYARLVGAAHRAGARVAVDSYGAPLELALAAGPEVVKVNAEEAAGLVGREVATREQAVAAARELHGRAGGGPAAAAVTRGVEGAVMAAPDGAIWEGSSGALGPYPVGSGDAFLAGLTVALERGKDWPRALALAVGAAAANAEEPGTGRFGRERAEQLAAGAAVAPLA